jgi:tRNA(Met) cytidine acetyltransferase
MVLTEHGLQGENQKVHVELQEPEEKQLAQAAVIEQIKKVALGHRKRPLVLTADRGRGKTAALGIALGQLINENPEKPQKLLVTAPQKSSIETLFRHALTFTPVASDVIRFVAVDDLVLNLPEADILVIDEAAGIPVPQLKTLTRNYHRLVFTTTVHGYEGSGRGFEVRFTPWLTENRKDTRFSTLKHPFRWFNNDCLEEFWGRALHMKKRELPHQNALAVTDLLADATAQLLYKSISKQELVNDQALLNAVFSLLVDAHYQTTPDDFVALLDAPDQQIFLAFVNELAAENLAAVVTGSIEGELCDNKLAHHIIAGQRRVQGHMLPQQLAYGTAEQQFLNYRYFRVIRIAVASHLRQKGIGSGLLNHVMCWCNEKSFNAIGSSFGATEALTSFWLKAGFTPALLGFHRDKATAEFNITVLKFLNTNLPNTDEQFDQSMNVIKRNFKALLFFHLDGIYQQLDNRLLTQLLNVYEIKEENRQELPCEPDLQKLALYCKGNRSLELTGPSLKSLLFCPSIKKLIKSEKFDLLMEYVLKKVPPTTLISRYRLDGRKHFQTRLKELTCELMELDGQPKS